MTQEDILEMAREAGYQHRNAIGQSEVFEYFDLEHFASLVTAAEREACAKVCDPVSGIKYSPNTQDARALCAATIRARGDL